MAWPTGRGRAGPRSSMPAALTQSPLEHGYPVTIWTAADVTDLLGRRGWSVSPQTVYRALHAMGYRYRRPRHDRTHRQDAEAVASAKHVLAELQQRGLLPGLDSDSFTWMNATSIPTPTWQKAGTAGAVPGVCRPPGPISGGPCSAPWTMGLATC